MIDSSDEADSLSAAPTAPGVDATSRNDYLRDLWYFAVPGQRLRRGRTMSITMLGEPLLVGRDRDGSPFALRDLCPHRGMPLSYGEFDGSEVQCHYHGWRFDTAGICRHIPSLVDSQRVTRAPHRAPLSARRCSSPRRIGRRRPRSRSHRPAAAACAAHASSGA